MTTRYPELVRVLRNLSAAPDAQQLYLEQLGTAPQADELALEFSDVLGLYMRRVSPLLQDQLRELDQLLESMSGPVNAGLWTTEALHRSSQWADVRLRAARILESLESSDDGDREALSEPK
jgi:hypothetical protein